MLRTLSHLAAHLAALLALALLLAPAAIAQTQTAKLTADDAAAINQFGISVSLSGDRALVGTELYRAPVYVYQRQANGTWLQTAKLTASDFDPTDSDQFGFSVSLSGDRAIVGAPGNDDVVTNSGAAYVFDLATCGSACTETAKLTASDGAEFDDFGRSVSLSGDRALVGASRDSGDGGRLSGSAYVFAFDGTEWSQQAKLTASDAAPIDFFGGSVSLSGDRALVGAIRSGAAYVFDLAGCGTACTETAILTAGVGIGSSVSLSGDRALVGGFGSAYVFDLAGGTWSQTAMLTASDDAASNRFGFSVALSGDRALVGDRFNEDPLSGVFRPGAAYVFDLAGCGTACTETVKLIANDPGEEDEFGASVSLSGARVLIGAPNNNDAGRNSGSAYVFELAGPAPVACAAGSFSDTGNAPCTLAPAGFFVATVGATEATACPAGTYQPDEGAASCLVADPGYLVSETAAVAQLACQLGTFSDISGAETCTRAAIGFYVDAEAATEATACPAGQTTTEQGSTSASDCFAPAASLTVSITPFGNPDVAHYGGLVFFRVRVDNDTDDRLRQDLWLTLASPSGDERVQYRTRVNLRPGRSAAGLFVTFVSRRADAGTYTYTASVGDYPSATQSDAFSFVKHERSNAKTGDDPVLAMNAFSDAEARTGGAVTEAVELRMDGGDAAAVWGDADGAWDDVLTDASAFELAAPFPNPSSGQTTVAFSVETAGAVRLTVYDALGREVAVLVEGSVEAGAHRVSLDSATLPTGVYLVRLTTADGQMAVQRLTVVR